MIFAAISFIGPALQIVVTPDAFNIRIQLVGACKDSSFARANRIVLSSTGDFSLAVADYHHGSVARLIHIHSVDPRT